MANFRFPEVPQLVDCRESSIEHLYLHLTTVAFRGTCCGEVWNVGGIAIDSNTNHIYLAEAEPPRVSIFSETGKYLAVFSHKILKSPWGIAVHLEKIYKNISVTYHTIP